MNELLSIPAVIAVVAAWHVGITFAKAKSSHANTTALNALRDREDSRHSDVLKALVELKQEIAERDVRLSAVEQLAHGVKNRLASAEAAAGTKPRGWSHGRAVKIG